MAGVFLLIMNIRFTIIIFIFILSFVLSQRSSIDFTRQLQEQDKAINTLKTEITKTRQDILKQQNKERSTAKKISSLEKEMSLTSQLINKLTRVERFTKSQIRQLEQLMQKMSLVHLDMEMNGQLPIKELVDWNKQGFV